MRNISTQDQALYGGLCGLNLLLLAIECWLIWISPFWILGVLIVTACSLIDLIVVFGCRKDSLTICWHTFMAVTCGLCSTFGMGSLTGMWCAEYEMDGYCQYMIAATVIGVVIAIVEIVLVQFGKRVGFSPCCCCNCCDPAPMIQPAVYPVYPAQTVITMQSVQATPTIQVAASLQPAMEPVATKMQPFEQKYWLPTYQTVKKK